jgi:hypothetical protein
MLHKNRRELRMPEIEQIASQVVTILAPFTPYLVEGGKKFAGKAGEAAWEKAVSVWQLLKSKGRHDSKIEAAATLLAAEPSDNVYAAAFEKALAALLETDPQLLRLLSEIVIHEHREQQLSVLNHGSVQGVSQTMQKSGSQRIIADGGSIVDVKQSM